MSAGRLPQPLRIAVPASTSNLGVGFDVLGLALTLENRFHLEPSGELRVTGCEERFRRDDNLVWTSYQRTCQLLGAEAQPLAIDIQTGIPLSGGLGSSSTCIIAGVAAALIACDEPLQSERVIEIASAIEGHADNVTASVLGGIASSCTTARDEMVIITWPVHESWRFVALCPPYEVRTADARRALPKEVPHSDVEWQSSRCLALVRAMGEGDGELLGAILDDHIHEPYRKNLIPDHDQAKELALSAGAAAGFWISGSGSTLLAACTSEAAAEAVNAAWEGAFPTYDRFILQANTSGYTVEREGA